MNASLDSSIVSVANTGRSLAERAIGVSDAERRWAKKLGVDPYSRNPILQAQLEKVGVLESSGTLAAGIATPAPLALTIAARVSDIVWEEPPGQLETHIESTLAKIGVGSSASRRFKLNPYFTLSRQVVFVDTLAGLPHVSGHADLVARASHADSEELAVFFTEAASMLAAFDKNQDRVDQLLPEAILVAARTERDRIVHFLPCDSVFWSAELSRNAAEVSRQMKENYPGATFEIVLSGRASDQARRGFEDLGWTVYEKVNTERD